MVNPYRVLWEGKIHVNEIDVNYDEKFNFKPSNELQSQRNNYWEVEKKKFPHIYDGDILFCDSFEIEEDHLTVNCGLVKYSFLNLILRKNIEFQGFKGYFAFRAKIKCQNSNNIMVGQKSKDSQFDPLHYTFPGGLFELSDLGSPLSVACKRELLEESKLSVHEESLFVRAINKHRRNNGVILQVQGEIKSEDCFEISQNEEWTHQGLRWINPQKLSHLDYSLLHDDIRYFMETNYN